MSPRDLSPAVVALLVNALGAEGHDEGAGNPTAAGLAIGTLDAIAEELDLLWMAMDGSADSAERFTDDVHRIRRRAEAARDIATAMRRAEEGGADGRA